MENCLSEAITNINHNVHSFCDDVNDTMPTIELAEIPGA